MVCIQVVSSVPVHCTKCAVTVITTWIRRRSRDAFCLNCSAERPSHKRQHRCPARYRNAGRSLCGTSDNSDVAEDTQPNQSTQSDHVKNYFCFFCLAILQNGGPRFILNGIPWITFHKKSSTWANTCELHGKSMEFHAEYSIFRGNST